MGGIRSLIYSKAKVSNIRSFSTMYDQMSHSNPKFKHSNWYQNHQFNNMNLSFFASHIRWSFSLGTVIRFSIVLSYWSADCFTSVSQSTKVTLKVSLLVCQVRLFKYFKAICSVYLRNFVEVLLADCKVMWVTVGGARTFRLHDHHQLFKSAGHKFGIAT